MEQNLIDEHRRGFRVFGDSSQLNHRALIIQSACDIERALVAILHAFFRQRRPEIPSDRIEREMLDEKGVLDSLAKLTKAAFYLGLIEEETKHDIQKIASLRNRYAHDRERLQLDNDPEMFKFITDTFLYKRNASRLAELRPQAVFLCVRDQLLVVLGGRNAG